MCAEGKCASDSPRPVTAVCPNSLEHSRILSKFAQTAFPGFVDALWDRRGCVASKWSRTSFGAKESWESAAAEMHYILSSTILRQSNPPHRKHRHRRGGPRLRDATASRGVLDDWAFGPLLVHLPIFARRRYGNGMIDRVRPRDLLASHRCTCVPDVVDHPLAS